MALSVLACMACTTGAIAQPGWVRFHQKISSTEGGFKGPLGNGDQFSSSVSAIGDLDGDGVGDMAVGTLDDDGGLDKGSVWILFMNADGTVKAEQKISSTQGGFVGPLDDRDWFGSAIAGLGDLDGDGVLDIAVGAQRDDDGANGAGAIYILFLNTDGTVKGEQKISALEGGFTGHVEFEDAFGFSLAFMGDLNGDEIGDLATGVWQDDDGGRNKGGVWILFLKRDGTVQTHQKISATQGGFTGPLDPRDRFGVSVASLGDLNDDDTADLAVGAFWDDDGADSAGAMWILFLNPDGTVRGHQKISATAGGFAGPLEAGDRFGMSAAGLGDLNGDGVEDLAVGAVFDDDGGNAQGAMWVLFLNENGTVASYQKISETEGGFTGDLDDADQFGISTAGLGDLDGDGATELAVGALWDDDGGSARGAVYVLFLEGAGAGGCARDPEWVCDGDTDGDGQVNPVDSGLVQAAFGSVDEQDLCNYDVDCDGQINPVDSEIVQSLFGTCDAPRDECP